MYMKINQDIMPDLSDVKKEKEKEKNQNQNQKINQKKNIVK